MIVLLEILRSIIQIYLLLLVPRIIVDFVQYFARSWRPRGFLLVVIEILYAVTDPPIKLARRFIKPTRAFGGVAIDLSFMAVVAAGWLLSFILTMAILAIA